MYLQNIHLQNFRNYTTLDFSPNRYFNYFFGVNGAGKTNFLEAIYFLINLQSFRRTTRAKLIREESGEMYLRGDFAHDEGGSGIRLEAAINGPARKYKVNRAEEGDLFSYLNKVHAVIFFPESLRFVKEGPHLRRAVFDRAVAAEDEHHLMDSREYAQLLVERNRILKQSGDSDMIDVWGERLLDIAARIIVRRHIYLKTLRQYIEAIGECMGVGSLLGIKHVGGAPSKGTQDWEIILGGLPKGKDPEEKTREFLGEIAESQKRKERELKRTLWGSHLDEFELSWGGRSAKEAASQGEQRLLTIILAMATAESYAKKRKDEPIVLLDDLSSELDEEKRSAILEYLEMMGTQVFITSTEKQKRYKNAGMYLVRDGKIFAEHF